MKNLTNLFVLIIFILIVKGNVSGQITINSDNNTIQTARSGSLMSYQTNQLYVSNNWTFTGWTIIKKDYHISGFICLSIGNIWPEGTGQFGCGMDSNLRYIRHYYTI